MNYLVEVHRPDYKAPGGDLFGPFRRIEDAEQCVIVLAARADVANAIIKLATGAFPPIKITE